MPAGTPARGRIGLVAADEPGQRRPPAAGHPGRIERDPKGRLCRQQRRGRSRRLGRQRPAIRRWQAGRRRADPDGAQCARPGQAFAPDSDDGGGGRPYFPKFEYAFVDLTPWSQPMNFRRQLLLSCFAVLSLGAASSHAQDVLRVGTDATFPPMEYVENGKRTGFDIELVEAIGKVLNKRIEWVDIDFKGLIPGLVSKRFDMSVSAIYNTDERKKAVDFTDSYYAGGLVAMVKEGNTAIKTLADLNGKKVAVQVGTKSVGYLTANHPKVQLVEVEKNQEMFNLVDIGRADAAVTGKPAAFQYVRTRGGQRVLEQQLTTEEYGMALRKDSPELTRAVNGALAKLKADGTYAQIVKKWFSNTASGTAK